ncbi:MGMT family protein [Rickettsiales bacterium]|nr:MGMT family protein [Rickettsiales bacterium]MDB2550333.1 MGMT family protein [Rickettsiales bacterium]
MDIKQQILEFLTIIPKNKVVTYKYLAEKFSCHPRKVAMIMKYNKNPDIYPCYKVILANGKISGYSADGGINSKIKKLKKDDIKIIDNIVNDSHILQ